jgi:hypothetical protein
MWSSFVQAGVIEGEEVADEAVTGRVGGTGEQKHLHHADHACHPNALHEQSLA